MKIAITDIETTGLDANTHEIIEIGLVVFDSESFETLDSLSTKVKPLRPDIFEPKAYELNGYTKELWLHAPSLKDVMKTYIEKTKDAMFAGHNPVLDFNFIVQALKQCGLENPFYYSNYHIVDIFTLAWAKIPHDKIDVWSLKNICKYLGVPEEPIPHRAILGAMTEYEVYKKLMTQPLL